MSFLVVGVDCTAREDVKIHWGSLHVPYIDLVLQGFDQVNATQLAYIVAL